MKDGFIRVAAATPDIKVADLVYNEAQVWNMIKEGEKNGAKLMVFPELCLTGYTCGDLFHQDILVDTAADMLKKLIRRSEGHDVLFFVGLPWMKDGKLYNVAAAVHDGELLALITKKNIPNYSEFYELRHFTPGPDVPEPMEWDGRIVPFGSGILLRCVNLPELVVAGEICEDVWVMDPPSISHARAGATVIVNCSASSETAGKHVYRRSLIAGQSARLVCGYICANAGEGESTQDLVFGGHDLIAENGTVLAESRRFENGMILADLDLKRICSERRRMTTFQVENPREQYDYMDFELEMEDLKELKRPVDPSPFIPSGAAERNERCEEILTIQAQIWSVAEEAMEREGLDPSAVCGLASIDLKSGEPGLCSLAEKLGVPFFTYTGEELAAVPGAFTESEFVRQVTGVGSVCERAAVAACREASEDTRLLMKKYARDGVTVAAACFIPELFKGSER